MTATAIATRERPILFSGPMVRAILEGRKTQTRRIAKPYTRGAEIIDTYTDGSIRYQVERWPNGVVAKPSLGCACKYGMVGDRLWVRETWSCPRQIGGSFVREKRMYKADELSPWLDYSSVVWKPSIHMPRQFSRLSLHLTAVRVERLQAITTQDALAEGIDEHGHELQTEMARDHQRNRSAIENFALLWDSLNAKRGYGWDVNPWVWVLAFRRVA
jgi:hypothetical protein